MRLYVAPAMGNIPLAKLEPADISRMLSRLGARGDLSPTIVRYSLVVRVALGRALRQGSLLRNVAALVEAPARARPEMQPLTAEQARALIASVRDHRHGPLFTLAIATGMRQGELLALRWQDIDLEPGLSP